MTLDCLYSVFDQTILTDYEVIVIDNNSSDGSGISIKRKFGDKIIYLESKENLGFCVANNKVADIATGEYLLLLNPDTIVLDNAIDKLIDCAEKNQEARIWGGRTIFSNGSLNKMNCFQKQSIWSLSLQAVGITSIFRNSTLLNPEMIGGWDRKGERRVDIISGSFFLIKKSFWDDLGGLNVDYFMYGEEADLCLRAIKIGAKPMVCTRATIIHYGGASQKIQSEKLVRLIRGKMMLINNHMAIPYRKLGVFILALWPISRFLAHSVLELLGRKSSGEDARRWKKVLTKHTEWFNHT